MEQKSLTGDHRSTRTPVLHKTTWAPPHQRWPVFEGSTASPIIGQGEGDISLSTNGQELLSASIQTKWDCRAASGSGGTQSQVDSASVGANTPDFLNTQAHSEGAIHNSGTQSVAGEQQPPHESYPQPQSNSTAQLLTACDPTHGPCLKLTGGAPDQTSSTCETDWRHTTMSTQYYAPTTELLLQNLSMVVGNPSARCFANAPWRAFCWMCAYLAEFNRDPWGVIKDAVQTSLELSEPVDIQRLPGLHQLWQKHDLNVEGDAAHFVHSLWIHSQTRVMQYRRTEIKEGGYVKENIQLPLIVDYPDEYLDEITWQELMNCWANQGYGQYLSDDKLVHVSHINRAVTIEGTVATREPSIHMDPIRSPDPWMDSPGPVLSTYPWHSFAIAAPPTTQGTTTPFWCTRT